MWMMGCNDGGEICLPTNNDSLSSGRKLRPLIPRPPPNPSTNSPNHHHHHHHHGRGNHHHGRGACDPDHHGLFALNHHLEATVAEQSKRDFNAAHQVVVCSRWNPTLEQLRALEEMYRRGTRTPSADQIQQITSQLRLYGQIEGKNVFYWFQNHKARERQKRRRQMESSSGAEEEKGLQSNHSETGNLQCKESGWASYKPSSDDVHRANSNTPNVNSNNSYTWETAEGSNIDKGEKSAMAGGGRGSASASSSATAVKATSTSSASSTAVVTSLWMKLNDNRELLLPNSNLIITGNSTNNYDNLRYQKNYDNLRRNAACPRLLPTPGPVVLPISTTSGRTILTALRSSSPPLPFPSQDFQTLQLFPLRSQEYEEERVCYVKEDNELSRQFFEFLPMKN